jgi:hypothetical protein
MATINLTLNVQVASGPQIQITKPKSVEADDKIEVIIKPDNKEQAIQIQPGDANLVSFLLIKSSFYGSELTYIVNDGGSNNNSANAIALDEPHLYLGTGAISVLGVAPKVLKFTNKPPTDPNKKPQDAAIEILVGRDATPN